MADKIPTNAPATPEPDRSEPSEERKAELRVAYQKGINAPYQGVEIRTIGELQWIFVERNWSTEYELFEDATHPNLSGARLHYVNLSGVNLRKANLSEADLRGTNLSGANLHEANLSRATLSEATLSTANLIKSNLSEANLDGAILDRADLRGANLSEANLYKATLDQADLEWARLYKTDLHEATLSGANFHEATLSGANMDKAILDRADLRKAMLDRANLSEANLSKANLSEANLSEANLSEANLEDVDLREADLSKANLSRTLFSNKTTLDRVLWKEPPILLGTRWNGVPLDGIDWNRLQPARLGNEVAVENAKNLPERVRAYRDAVRAYHGLVVALENQGLTEPARRFRQRERTLERRALQADPRTWGTYLFYSLLNLVSGQGEEPQRIFVAYALIISVFTGIYWAVSNLFATSSQPLLWYEALVLSLSSFHGRGFFPSQIGLGDPLAIVAAVEAVIGLFIELILIATFSNRFLNK